MTTVSKIISRALRRIKVIGEAETPTPQEFDDCLQALNSMLDLWRNDRLTVYRITQNSFTATGAASYSIGTGATWNTDAPVKIETAMFRLNGTDTPIDIIDEKRWSQISSKTLTGDPDLIYLERNAPSGTIYLHPIPSDGTVILGLWQPFSVYTSTADDVTLPPGYEEAITSNLAVFVADEFDAPPSETLVAIAKASKRSLQNRNAAPIIATSEPAYLRRGQTYDIYRGY